MTPTPQSLKASSKAPFPNFRFSPLRPARRFFLQLGWTSVDPHPGAGLGARTQAHAGAQLLDSSIQQSSPVPKHVLMCLSFRPARLKPGRLTPASHGARTAELLCSPRAQYHYIDSGSPNTARETWPGFQSIGSFGRVRLLFPGTPRWRCRSTKKLNNV